MAKKSLNKVRLGPNEDWYGNNAAVRCPICRKVFIVSGFIAKGQRTCPGCQKATAAISNEQVTIEWPEEIELLTRPELESAGRLDEFVRLVSEGGAIKQKSIYDKLPRTDKAAFIERDGKMVAVAAVKSPSPQRAQTLTRQTGYQLGGDIPELGYVAVVLDWRGLGLSSMVVQKALSAVGGGKVFATTRNIEMKHTLGKHDFVHVGREYDGDDLREKLSLWVQDQKTGVKAALTPEEQAVVDRAIGVAVQSGYLMEVHQCFRNAQAVFAADHVDSEGSHKLRYHEGYAPWTGGAAPHAWLTINGKIVDVTLQHAPNRDKILAKIAYYLADVVPPMTVLTHFTESKKRNGFGSIRGLKQMP